MTPLLNPNAVGLGYANPEAQAGPGLPPPNPDLGQRMANRDWAGREAQINYEMQHAPMPTQYTRDRPHPVFGGGSGNPLTQYARPAGPPTGFPARGLAPAYVAAGGRSPVVYGHPGMLPGGVRPTAAYNRGPAPTQYAWPAQYYPGGNNTYIPTWEATGLLVKFTRDITRFRINKYLKTMKVPKKQGYYLTLNGQDPYRVVSINDYLWDDSADAPGGRQERQGFGFQPYLTARYCFAFNLGEMSVAQAEWPIVAEHAAMAGAKSMTVRTLINTTLLTTTANWSGVGFTNTSAASGAWSSSSITNSYIQTDINTAMIAVEQASGGIVTDEEALQLTLNPVETRLISKSPEYKQYITGSPDALAAITDQRNPNRKYGMAPYLYGLGLVVENAVVVTTPKSGNVPTQPAQTQSYVWPAASGCITSKPTGIVQSSGEQTLDFSTICARFYEEMTTEQKSDPDNRREVGRVVEDYVISLQAPQTGYLLTGLS